MEQKVKQEYSAGGCVYKKVDGTVKWLLGNHSGYHKWVLPKGLIEPGEEAAGTALREVKEETGVTAKILDDKPIYIEKYEYIADFKVAPSGPGPVRRVAQYQESGGGQTKVSKTVTFFLMEWIEGDPKDHDWEMADAGWYTGEEALKILDFLGEQEALRQAQGKLLKGQLDENC